MRRQPQLPPKTWAASMHCFVRVPVIIAVLVGVAAAQQPFSWTIQFSPEFSGFFQFGRSMDTADFNKDGFEDLLVMEPRAQMQGKASSGRGWILFGPSLQSWIKFAPTVAVFGEEFGGAPVSIGDANSDGWLDLLIPAVRHKGAQGQAGAGRAYLLFGPGYSDQMVFDDPTPDAEGQFGLGNELVDVTGDGLDDVVISAHWATGLLSTSASGLTGLGSTKDGIGFVGEVWWWDARDPLIPHLVPAMVFQFGGDFGGALSASDLDGTGLKELLVGAVGVAGACCPAATGELLIVETPAFHAVDKIQAPIGLAGFGFAHHFGDLTHDGVADLLVGAPYSAYFGPPFQPSSGLLALLAGPELKTVGHTFQSPTPWLSQAFGEATAVADINRDGADDVIVGDPGEVWGQFLERTHIFYGPDFTQVQSLGDDFTLLTDGFGKAVATGDFDGDGFEEIAVYAPLTFGTGGVLLYDRQSLQADAASLSVTAGGQVGFTLDLGPEVAGGHYLAALSLSGSGPGMTVAPGAWLPLNPDALTSLGLSLLGSPALQGFLGVLDSQGDAAFTLSWPSGFGTILAGQTLTVAAIAGSPAGIMDAGSSPVTIALVP